MISTFALNMEFPIQTTRNVYLEILKLGFNQIVTLNHKDMLSALEQEDLQFQIRKILDPSWKG